MQGTTLYRGESAATLSSAPDGRWWSVDPLYASEFLGEGRELLTRVFDFSRVCDLRECLNSEGFVSVTDFNRFLQHHNVEIPEHLKDGGDDLIDSFVIQEFLDFQGSNFEDAGFECVIHPEHGNTEEPAVLIFK